MVFLKNIKNIPHENRISFMKCITSYCFYYWKSLRFLGYFKQLIVCSIVIIQYKLETSFLNVFFFVLFLVSLMFLKYHTNGSWLKLEYTKKVRINISFSFCLKAMPILSIVFSWLFAVFQIFDQNSICFQF